MWTKIEVVPSDTEMIYLPSSWKMICKQSTVITFGKKSAHANIQYINSLELPKESSFESPGKIWISDKLKNKLFIQESLVYQIKLSDSNIIIGPVIGLLLGVDTYRYTPNHMKKYSDRFGIYHKVGGLIYAFSPLWVDWENHTAYGLYYNICTTRWEYGCFPLPEVIYRRNFHIDDKLINKLMDSTDGKLFNSYRFSKYELYEAVRRESELSKYLPPTELLLDFDQVREFIDRHQKVILKPTDLSRGRGICVIEKTNSAYKITDYRNKRPTYLTFYRNESLKSFFASNQNLFNKYLIQKYLPLATIGNSPFDIRVVMQKRSDQTWGCTGIECRVSNGGHLTNISRGGYALSLNEALDHTFPANSRQLSQQVHEFCKKLCSYMDDLEEHFAEFGIDVAFDVDGNLWLIEANVFPSFKGFKKMDPKTYLAIRYTPLLYALSLTPFGEELL